MPINLSNDIVDYGQFGQRLGDEDFATNTWNWSETMDWSADNVTPQTDGGVMLSLDESTDGVGAPYEGGAVQSMSVSSVGTWSWMAQAPDMVSGAVFGMFLYRESHVNDPWLEYDIEFVGGDTTRVQLAVHMEDDNGNRVTNFGQVIVDLGFDASEGAHLYEIVVKGESTEFRVDGETVWTFNSDDMPNDVWLNGNMRSITSLWAANEKISSWAGDWNYPGTPLEASIFSIGTPEYPIPSGEDNEFGENLISGAGNDTIMGNGANNNINLGGGNNLAYCGAGNDTVRAGAGDDVVCADGGDDVIFGGAGSDQLRGGAGEDTLRGGAGEDALRGGVDNDRLSGGTGNDSLFGGDDDDWLGGGKGNDRLQGDSGSDVVKGGSGDDTLIFNAAANVGDSDVYVGGSDIDTMVFQFTAAEYSSSALQVELDGYNAFITSNTDAITGEASSARFQFTTIGLEVGGMENVEIYVDGILV